MKTRLKGFERFEDANRRILASHPEAEALWNRTAQRRKFSEFLLKARYRAGLSQAQIAEYAGWDKSFVSRLESVSGPVPDILTISRYMTACNATIGLVLVESIDPDHAGIIDSVPLNSSKLGELVVGKREPEAAF